MKIQTTFEGETLILSEEEFKAFIHDVLQQALTLHTLDASVKLLRKSVESLP